MFTPQETQYNSSMNNDINDKKNYLSINSEQAYELVKTGVWSLGKFQNWLDYVIRDAELEAKYGGC